MSESEEIEVIKRVIDGEIGAFAVFVQVWQAPLIRMLSGLLRDRRALAEDVAQDVFVEAFRRLPTFDPGRSRFSSWLFMIGRSRGINALKKKCPRFLAEPPEAIAPGSPSEARDDFEVLDRALQELPAVQRRAFLLAAVEELPHAEVAQIEGVAEGTIKSRVSRARAYLRDVLNTQNGK